MGSLRPFWWITCCAVIGLTVSEDGSSGVAAMSALTCLMVACGIAVIRLKRGLRANSRPYMRHI